MISTASSNSRAPDSIGGEDVRIDLPQNHPLRCSLCEQSNIKSGHDKADGPAPASTLRNIEGDCCLSLSVRGYSRANDDVAADVFWIDSEDNSGSSQPSFSNLLLFQESPHPASHPSSRNEDRLSFFIRVCVVISISRNASPIRFATTSDVSPASSKPFRNREGIDDQSIVSPPRGKR